MYIYRNTADLATHEYEYQNYACTVASLSFGFSNCGRYRLVHVNSNAIATCNNRVVWS